MLEDRGRNASRRDRGPVPPPSPNLRRRSGLGRGGTTSGRAGRTVEAPRYPRRPAAITGFPLGIRSRSGRTASTRQPFRLLGRGRRPPCRRPTEGSYPRRPRRGHTSSQHSSPRSAFASSGAAPGRRSRASRPATERASSSVREMPAGPAPMMQTSASSWSAFGSVRPSITIASASIG